MSDLVLILIPDLDSLPDPLHFVVDSSLELPKFEPHYPSPVVWLPTSIAPFVNSRVEPRPIVLIPAPIVCQC
jgi:hypothetical protein